MAIKTKIFSFHSVDQPIRCYLWEMVPSKLHLYMFIVVFRPHLSSKFNACFLRKQIYIVKNYVRFVDKKYVIAVCMPTYVVKMQIRWKSDFHQAYKFQKNSLKNTHIVEDMFGISAKFQYQTRSREIQKDKLLLSKFLNFHYIHVFIQYPIHR